MNNFYSPMKSISSNARVLTPKPQVQQLLDLRQLQSKARNSVTWLFINIFFLSIVLYDIMYGGPMYKLVCWIEWCFASIFTLNAIYHFGQYIWAILSLHPIMLNPQQRPLLGVSEDDPLFKDEVSPQQKFSEPSPSLNLSCINLTRRTPLTSSVLNEINMQKDYSLSPVVKYNSPISSKSTASPNGSFNKSLSVSLNGSLSNEDLIRDECELESYLQEVEQQRKCTLHMSTDQPSNLLSSFWSHPAIRRPGEVSPLLRRCAYQLAPTVDKTKATTPGATKSSSPRGTFGALNVWRKYRVDPNKVNEWTANLRMWISKTVVERVALEIDDICATLIRHGLSDSQPGHVGLDRLRKLAQAPFLVSAIPTLPTLVPFLELCNNQEYLVKRIKTLAKGGSMSEFKWNSGGSHNGREWDSSLPTDSAIIMHLISTYMDTQLEAPLDQPDARPFTSRYMARSGMELPRNKGPIIVCQSVNPPHYSLALSCASSPVDFEEVPRGRNNLFHTILLFLYIVKTRNHGRLGRVNAGSSGINILWVIDG